MSDRPLSTAQAAELLGVSEPTIRRLVAAGELPAWRAGKRGALRFNPRDLRRYIEQNRAVAEENAIQRHPDPRGLIHLSATTAERSAVRLSTTELAAGDFRVDEQAGALKNVTVIAAGPALGHRFMVDEVMLRQVRDSINASENNGVKSRLGHPDIFADGIGTAIGRVRNARVSKGKVKADLFLSEYAAKSPKGDLRTYVLQMAQEDPSAAGMSIVFEPGDFEETDSGELIGRVKKVAAVDVVDTPAASANGMLAKDGTHMPGKTVDETKKVDETSSVDESKSEDNALVLRERRRIREINQLAHDLEAVDQRWAQEQIDGDVSLEAARNDALAKQREYKRRTRPAIPEVSVGEDHNLSTLSDAFSDALAHRRGVSLRDESERANQFKGRSIPEMIRGYLEALGCSTRGMGPAALVRAVSSKAEMSKHVSLSMATGDFPALLADSIGKSLRQAYGQYSATWPQWCKRTTASDFKPIKRAALSGTPVPPRVAEGAEYEYVTVDDVQEVYTLAKYGQQLAVTWESMVNDDLDALNSIDQRFAASARMLEDDLAYSPITSNQVMAEDGKPLFHADHGNLISSGSAISVSSLGKMRSLLARQTGPKGNVLNIRPAVLLTPVEIATAAEQLVASTVDPSKANRTPNPFQSLDVVAEPRLSQSSEKAWYLAASSAQFDTVEVCFLDDQPEPFIEQRDSFDTDTIRYKFRHACAGRAIDHRGLTKNPGA